ncbi:carbohydrate kinase [Micrococcales bacterium 31B]|nr:carbohydrate kinase [Micrococcales bacterium 31B]
MTSSSYTSRALAVGEALIDILNTGDGASQHVAGGSPMNTAVALARLGHDAFLMTHYADDDLGALITSHLAASQVTVTEGSLSASRTPTAAATVGADGAATYVFDLEWDIDPSHTPEQLDVVHSASIATVLQPGADKVFTLLESLKAQATITFDPNARPAIMGDPADVRPVVERFVALADVVKASDEDLEWLYPGEPLDAVITRWQSLGPALVVATRGADGALAATASGLTSVPSRKVTVIDTVGAGDTFSAGIIDELGVRGLLGASQREALRAIPSSTVEAVLNHAAACAAITVSRQGANPPTRAEVRGSDAPAPAGAASIGGTVSGSPRGSIGGTLR